MSWLKSLFGARRPPPPSLESLLQSQEEEWRTLLETCPFPFTVVDTLHATQAWRDARIDGARAGYSPVIFTAERPFTFEDVHTADEVANIKLPSFEEVLEKLVLEEIDTDGGDEEHSRKNEFKSNINNEYTDNTTASNTSKARYLKNNPYSYLDFTYDSISELPVPAAEPTLHLELPEFAHFTTPSIPPYPKVAIARIPTPRSWEIPLFVYYPYWIGACEPEDLAVFARHWKETYDADLACITVDMMEFAVERPPASFEESKRLFLEQFLVASEGFDFDPTTASKFVAQLRTARTWSFWWD